MTAPVKITHRHDTPSAALDVEINTWIQKLEKLFDRIIEWRVVVDAPRHAQHAQHFKVHLAVAVPGEELIVDHDPPKASHQDAHVAVADAFRAMQGRLQAYAEVRRREVKAHSLPSAK